MQSASLAFKHISAEIARSSIPMKQAVTGLFLPLPKVPRTHPGEREMVRPWSWEKVPD